MLVKTTYMKISSIYHWLRTSNLYIHTDIIMTRNDSEEKIDPHLASKGLHWTVMDLISNKPKGISECNELHRVSRSPDTISASAFRVFISTETLHSSVLNKQLKWTGGL